MASGESDRSELDRRIEALANEDSILDPEAAVGLLREFPEATLAQLKELWKISVGQSAAILGLRSNGDESPRLQKWQELWNALADSLQTAMQSPGTGDDFNEALAKYRESVTAARVSVPFRAAVIRLEGSLARQRALLGFHYDDDENAYRTRERALSDRLCAAVATDEQRAEVAREILATVQQYREAFLGKVDTLTADIEGELAACGRFVSLFSPQNYGEVHRWYALTARLVPARQHAVRQIHDGLEWDCLVPLECLEGRLRVSEVEGKSTLCLTEDATARFQGHVDGARRLTELSANVEEELREERGELARQLIGEESPTEKDSEETGKRPATEGKRRRHPLENRPWFRFFRLCMWGTGVVFVLSALTLGWAFEEVLAGGTFVGLVLLAIRGAVLYVALGRLTLYERPNSGFIDLDLLEAEMAERSEEGPEGRAEDYLADLRRRYGRRAPEPAVREFIDKNLNRVRAEKKRLLRAADREGKTVNISALRENVIENLDHLSPSARGEAVAQAERMLLRLEVKHGPEIPVSVLSDEADAADERVRESERV